MSENALYHIAWAKTEPERHRFNLSESGVEAPDLEALGLPSRAGIPAAGYALRPELERILGARWGAPGGRVLLACGGSEANALVFAGLLRPGEAVLAESPGYEPHRIVPPLFGVRVRRFERRAGVGGGALAEAVEAALTPDTRMVVLTHLHNPTGEPLTLDSARALNDLAARRGVWLLCDEIFRDVLPGALGTFATLGPRWVVTSSLTKVYGLGGLRIGWVAGSEEVLARCAVVQDGLSGDCALPSIALALELTPHLDTLRARTQRFAEANGARWNACLGRGMPFAAARSTGATTAWAAFPREGEGDAFAAFASKHHSVAVTPGRFFGESRGFRVGLVSEPARFAAAIDSFERAVAAFASGETAKEIA